MNRCDPRVLSKHILSHFSALNPGSCGGGCPVSWDCRGHSTGVAQDPHSRSHEHHRVAGSQASRPLLFAGKIQYFALIRDKSWMVGSAAWPKPSSAKTDVIYFVADNLALFFSSSPLCNGPMACVFGAHGHLLVCWAPARARSSPFLHHLAKPPGASWSGWALCPWGQGLGQTASPSAWSQTLHPQQPARGSPASRAI